MGLLMDKNVFLKTSSNFIVINQETNIKSRHPVVILGMKINFVAALILSSLTFEYVSDIYFVVFQITN